MASTHPRTDHLVRSSAVDIDATPYHAKPVASALALSLPFGLATPVSLPRLDPSLTTITQAYPFDQLVQSASHNDEARNRSASEESLNDSLPAGDDAGPDEVLSPFTFDDVDMHSQDGSSQPEQCATRFAHHSLPLASRSERANDAQLSDRVIPLATAHSPRRYRARYYVEDGEAYLPPPQFESSAGELATASTYKRTFEEVSLSASTTCQSDLPAVMVDTMSSFSPFTADTEVAVSFQTSSQYRHNLESQRARVTSRMRLLRDERSESSTLRRRSPMASPSGARICPTVESSEEEQTTSGVPRPSAFERYKRRRNEGATRREIEVEHESFAAIVRTPSSSLSHAFAPALGRYSPRFVPIDPLLSSPSAPLNRIATGLPSDDLPSLRRGRLSFSSLTQSQEPSLYTPISPPSLQCTYPEQGWLSSLRSTQSTQSTKRSFTTFPAFPSLRRPSISAQAQATTSGSALINAVASTSSFSSPPNMTSLLRPRSAQARSEPTRERELEANFSSEREEHQHRSEGDDLDRRGREILAAASGRIAASEALLSQYRSEWVQPHRAQISALIASAAIVDHDDATIRERFPSGPQAETQTNSTDLHHPLPELPSTRHLLSPAEILRRPVVNFRVREGWNTSALNRSSETTAASAEISSSPIEDRSPFAEQNLSDSTEASDSRTVHGLTCLRARRRPRLSRNSTGVPPPEESPDFPTTEREAEGWINPSSLGDHDGLPSAESDDMSPVAAFLASPETVRASSSWSEWRGGVRQRTSDRLGDPSGHREASSISRASALWGQVDNSDDAAEESSTHLSSDVPLSARRLRLPTQRANERWRLGLGPMESDFSAIDASVVTTTETAGTATVTPMGNSPSRHPWRVRPVRAPHLAVTPAGPDPGAVPSRLSSRSTSDIVRNELSPFARSESPSPRSGRSMALSRRVMHRGSAVDETFTYPSIPDEPVDPIFTESTEHPTTSGTGRPSIRITRSLSRSFSGVRPILPPANLLADDPSDEAPQLWRPPTLPPMLPSGAAGRRTRSRDQDWRAALQSGALWEDRLGGEVELDGEATPYFPAWNLQPRPASRAPIATSSAVAERGVSPADMDAELRPSPRVHSETSLPARPRSTLADALAHFGSRTSSNDGRAGLDTTRDMLTLRRRRATVGTIETGSSSSELSTASPPADGLQAAVATLTNSAAARATTTFGVGANRDRDRVFARERLAAERNERLAALSRERAVMRTLLDGTAQDRDDSWTGDLQQSDNYSRSSAAQNLMTTETSIQRSPGAVRRRAFGEFWSRVGGVSGRLFGTLDDDFSAFFGRDSAALDPRNYLDDDEFDSSYDALLRLSERLGDVKSKGVSPAKMSALKVFAYKEWPIPSRDEVVRTSEPATGTVATTSVVTIDVDTPAFARKGVEKEARCGVCLADYEDDDNCMLGHCLHGFHAECLTAWLKEHGTCPVCRRDHAA